ncbi:MAG: hypothetical protein IAG13_10545 [Deltaproteobacteria bacterium]|nr:hypothetical protein [Nannocystaceae bacterium]
MLLPASWLLFACPVDSNDDIGDSDDPTGTATTMTTGMSASTTTSADDTSESGSSDTAPADVDYETDIQPIWNENCLTGCHETGGIYAALPLGAGVSYNALLTQKPVYSSDANFVVVDDAADSLLVAALRGTDTILRQMPLELSENAMGMPEGIAGTPLPEADIAKVEAWIDAGAVE